MAMKKNELSIGNYTHSMSVYSNTLSIRCMDRYFSWTLMNDGESYRQVFGLYYLFELLILKYNAMLQPSVEVY